MSKARDTHLLSQTRPAQGRQERAQATGSVDLLSSVRTQHEHRPVGDAPGEVVQEFDGSGIGPVEVIHKEKHWCLLRKSLDQPRDSFKEASLFQGSIAQGLRSRQTEVGEQSPQIRQTAH